MSLKTLGAAIVVAALAGTALAQGDDSTTVQLGPVVTVTGGGVTQRGADVLITEPGVYVLAGTLEAGGVEVRAPGGEVTLVLDGVSITNPDGPAIWVLEAEHVTVTLADGSHNVLADGPGNDEEVALATKVSLTIEGEGSLDVHAVAGEGIESERHITIESGTIHIYALEDGINANEDGVSSIVVNGGYVYIQTEEGDGIDSNWSLTINGGTVITQAALVDANSGLDGDGPVAIHGGFVVATGSPMMGALAASESQEAILVNLPGSQPGGTLVVVRSEEGDERLTFAPAIPFRQLIFSSPALKEGVVYEVYVGGVAAGDAVDGLFAAPAAEPGTLVASVTTESARSGGRFGPGFRGPRGPAPPAPVPPAPRGGQG